MDVVAIRIHDPGSLYGTSYIAAVAEDTTSAYGWIAEETKKDRYLEGKIPEWWATESGYFSLEKLNLYTIKIGEELSSNLVIHARRELELIGEDADVIDWYCKVIQAFADFGHSGGSMSATLPVLTDLLQFKNLRPLTNNPSEWIHVAEAQWGRPGGIWQNCRNGQAFSNDGGKTYYLLSEGGSDQNRHPLHTSVDA